MRQINRDERKPQYRRKAALVSSLTEKLDRSRGTVLVEYRGLTVKDTTDLRGRLRKVDAELGIAKNTLLGRAIETRSMSELSPFLEGPNAVVFAYADSVAAVKTLADFARENRMLVLKGGLVEGRVFGADQLGEIAKMPPREQIIGQLLGALQAPAAGLVGILQAPMAQLVFTLQAVAASAQSA